jgi:hypothetical protein
MGFLNNSGDIILDAVLTDLGRKKLAAGDGSFRIVKFALSDEEIDYSQYDKTAATGQEDLDILASPVFEAFTNNTSTMKSLLLSIPRTDLLFLPILKVNDNSNNNFGSAYSDTLANTFIVSCTDTTDTNIKTVPELNYIPYTSGRVTGTNNIKNIVIDQGFNSTSDSVPATSQINQNFPELYETSYMVEIDNRLGNLLDPNAQTIQPSFIDDDNIATYILNDDNTVSTIEVKNPINTSLTSIHSGSPGSRLTFSLKASVNLQSSDTLFDLLGTSVNLGSPSKAYKRIITNITVTGMTTGYSIEVPVAFYKYIG